jgi:hypothetical protein
VVVFAWGAEENHEKLKITGPWADNRPWELRNTNATQCRLLRWSLSETMPQLSVCQWTLSIPLTVTAWDNKATVDRQ